MHPLAYLLTFTSYGTWLHGDERGSVNRRIRGRSKVVAADPILHEHMRGKLNHAPVELNGSMRKVVREACKGYCEFKQWPLRALHVRTNHVHLVVSAVADSARMLNGLKARATRMLREAELLEADRPIWTERGNIGLLFTRKAVAEAIDYVMHQQGDLLPDE